MIDGNFKKWSREWSNRDNRDNTVKVVRSHSIYKDKETDTEDLIIDIEIEEDDVTEVTITCDIDELAKYNDNTSFENEDTVHDFVNNQIISYNRKGQSVKASVRNKILRIV